MAPGLLQTLRKAGRGSRSHVCGMAGSSGKKCCDWCRDVQLRLKGQARDFFDVHNTNLDIEDSTSEMSAAHSAARQTFRCLRQATRHNEKLVQSPTRRGLASTATRNEEASLQSTSSASSLDPALVSTAKEERQLMRSGIRPIGSRRRRAALQGSANLPFEQLPYQAFQEARKILGADREEKLQQIEIERGRIARLQAQDPGVSGGEIEKDRRLTSMRKYLEELKILADINDPAIKKRFEDGEGMRHESLVSFISTNGLIRRS